MKIDYNIRRKLIILFFGICLLSFSSCFTGVESTQRITNKDVIKQTLKYSNALESSIDTIKPLPFNNWYDGKKFYATDSLAKLVFMNNESLNSINAGDTLRYKSYKQIDMYGATPVVLLEFRDKNDNQLFYNTNKSIDALSADSLICKIPFLIDLDMIQTVKKEIVGKDWYIKSNLWNTENGELKDGKKFVLVKILDVLPGNKVYSLNIKFAYDNKVSYIYVATKDNGIFERTFDAAFSSTNPHLKYPTITDVNWSNIINGIIVEGMTKEECRLAIGSPNDVDKNPTYNGLQELWRYNNGIYLIFTDGLLTKYRK